MQGVSRTSVFNYLKILIIFATYLQCMYATPYPEQVPFNYYFGDGKLLHLESQDDTFFTIGGELPAMTITYKPNADLHRYDIISYGVIANTSDPNLVDRNEFVYGDRVCDIVSKDKHRDSYIGYIVIKQILRFLHYDCTTPQSYNPYLISYGFHNVVTYDRFSIPCNKTWFYHLWVEYKDETSELKLPLRAIYQVDVAPGKYHCDPEIYAQYA